MVLAAVTLIAIVLALLPFGFQPPASPGAQWAGACGALALLVPFLFSVFKRSGLSASPPFWFVGHVLFACLGVYLILYHAAAGNWVSPPGFVLFLMLFLVIQGALLRTSISAKFSRLFARSSSAPGFSKPDGLDKARLRVLIECKQSLLRQLDAGASEAVFSPNLQHWMRRPLLSLKYQRLISMEANMVGARHSAGVLLAWSRRLHMLVAVLFFLGLISHIAVVLFFAGYAAGGEAVDWWYITDWGR
ncbi:MAG: hypothetical protein GY784_09375 [Gammaproteobacteria bacterium]|nr:hypothetical protein [Gammaproteobacteria bacterium]